MEEKKSEAAEGSDSVNKLECAICLQPSIQPVQLPCRHIFCYLCVKGATQQSKRCAMCRQEIPLNYLDNPQLIAVEEPNVAFEGSYQWFYEGRNGWWRYDSRTSIEIENAYKKGEPQCEVLIAGFLYIIDFEKNLQYRRYDPYRRRRIKRDFISIPIKGVAGIRIEDNEVSSSNDNEAVCSSSSDNSSNAETQAKLAEFMKLRAEVIAELEEEEEQERDDAPVNHCFKCDSVSHSCAGALIDDTTCGSGRCPGSSSSLMPGPVGQTSCRFGAGVPNFTTPCGNKTAPGSPLGPVPTPVAQSGCKSGTGAPNLTTPCDPGTGPGSPSGPMPDPVRQSGCGSSVGEPNVTTPCGPRTGPGSSSGPVPSTLGLSMHAGIIGLPAGGCHSGWKCLPIAHGPLGGYGPGCSVWGYGSRYSSCGCHCRGHGLMSKPALNAQVPVIVNNFFGPTVGGPASTVPVPSTLPAGEQTDPPPPPPGMGIYPQEPSNFGPTRTGFCAGCSNNNAVGNSSAQNPSNVQSTTANAQCTKTTGQTQGYLPYRR